MTLRRETLNEVTAQGRSLPLIRISDVYPAQGAIHAQANHNKTDRFNNVREAEILIGAAEAIRVSERDFEQILELLEHPPKPNAKLRAAIAALPRKI
ncbi:DUF1778 domain-containing protein [Mesorhizobium tamadayense]|uniref:DUF1778 domain-containing protein n=2 Tax=Mesorhizobium tamadayense TaxID=425306 RepID=A0A3P3G692_9HYPH|nr:DUF1778 domain-containing protein [Mesorhizobium tamadayense]